MREVAKDDARRAADRRRDHQRRRDDAVGVETQ
jgi:hypothetical protein